MAEQYLRKVVLDIVPQSGGAVTRIENLRIKFTVKKTPKSNPNTAEISIFNLSEKTRTLVESKNCHVVLNAGYLGLNPDGILKTNLFSSKSVENVFRGNIKKFSHDKSTKITDFSQHTIEGPDIITKLECGDGDEVFTTKTFDKGYPADTKLTVLFKDLSDALSLPKGSQITIPENNIANGITFSGLVRDHLDNLCARYGLEWSIQNEALQIVTAGSFSNDGIVVLNNKTGLIGSPAKTKDGVEFKCLLQPALRPGKRVNLDSKFVKGTFTCRNVTHDGDSHQDTFLTKIEAKI